MLVLIKSNNDIFTIEVDTSDTINNVKVKIFAEYDVDPDQQSLIFAGCRLTGGTLSDNNIHEFDTIICVTPAVVWSRRVGGVY